MIKNNFRLLLILVLVIFSCDLVQAESSLVLTLDEAVAIGHKTSNDAKMAKSNFMGKYLSYCSYQAQWRPFVNLSGNLLNYDRSIVGVRDAKEGVFSYVENHSLSNDLALSITQNLPWMNGTLSLRSNLSRLDQFKYGLTTYYSNPLLINYQQPLNGYSYLKWRKKMAPLEYERAKRVYLESMQSVTLTVVRLFFSALLAQEDYEQGVRQYLDLESLFDKAKSRHELGLITRSEILQLELSVLNAKMNVSKLKLSLENQMFALFSYLQIPIHDIVKLQPADEIPILTLDLAQVTALAVKNSSYSYNQQLNLLSAQESLANEKSSAGIQISIQAQAGLTQTSNDFVGAYKDLIDNEVIGLSFSIPVCDWGINKRKVKVAKAELDIVKAQIAQADLEFEQDIRAKVQEFDSQYERCSISQRAKEIAQERYEIMKQRFENGTVNVTELNTSQQEYENARYTFRLHVRTFWEEYYTLQKLTLFDFINNCYLDVDYFDVLR